MKATWIFIVIAVACVGCSGNRVARDRFDWIEDETERAMRNAMWTKLESTRIPLVQLQNASHADVLSDLSELSRKHDPGLPPHPGKGIKFARATDSSVYNPMFSLREENAPLLQIIQKICDLSGAKFRIHGDTVYISGELRLSEQPDGAVTQESARSAAP
jgi:hypothetical protein